jgi:mannose-6-phosphate isomerase-like protein (cupin superfamily)
MWKLIDANQIEYTPYRKGVVNIKRIIEKDTVEMKSFTGFGLLELPPKGVFPPHTHPVREEIYYILKGSGIVVIGGKEIQATEGQAFYISGDIEHGILNPTNERFEVFFVHVQV